MRENLNQWDFVIACYVIGIGATLAMIGWAWAAMRKAEAKREAARSKRAKDL